MCSGCTVPIGLTATAESTELWSPLQVSFRLTHAQINTTSSCGWGQLLTPFYSTMPTAHSLPRSSTEKITSSTPPKIPSVHVRGAGYERGLITGRAFKDLIQSRISADVTLQQALIPFYGTDEGRTLSEDLFRTNRYFAPYSTTLHINMTKKTHTCSLLLLRFPRVWPYYHRATDVATWTFMMQWYYVPGETINAIPSIHSPLPLPSRRNLYPDYFEEIRGTAEGSEVPLEQVHRRYM